MIYACRAGKKAYLKKNKHNCPSSHVKIYQTYFRHFTFSRIIQGEEIFLLVQLFELLSPCFPPFQ